jgi:hypothetical protein
MERLHPSNGTSRLLNANVVRIRRNDPEFRRDIDVAFRRISGSNAMGYGRENRSPQYPIALLFQQNVYTSQGFPMIRWIAPIGEASIVPWITAKLYSAYFSSEILAISCAQPSVERSVSIRGRASTFLAPRHQSIQVYACRFAKGQRASRIPFAGRRAPTWKAQAFGYFQDMHRASVSELGLKSGCSRPFCGTESLSSAARHWLLIPETVTLPSKLAGAKAPAQAVSTALSLLSKRWSVMLRDHRIDDSFEDYSTESWCQTQTQSKGPIQHREHDKSRMP